MIGFDRRIGKFFLFGIDQLTNSPIYAKGDYNKDKKEFMFTGEDIDIVEKKPIPFKITITFEDEGKYTYRMFVTKDGKETKAVETINVKK